MQYISGEEGHPLDLYETYLAMIEGSVGTRQYQCVYVRKPTGLVDVTGEGNFSCAFYVSAVLTLCGLLARGVHTTVDETVRDMLQSGWYPINEPRIACVVLYQQSVQPGSDGVRHRHLGFFVGGFTGESVISNHPVLRVPQKHHITFGSPSEVGYRPIEALYFHERLLEWC